MLPYLDSGSGKIRKTNDTSSLKPGKDVLYVTTAVRVLGWLLMLVWGGRRRRGREMVIMQGVLNILGCG
jgi:hypothetical protein